MAAATLGEDASMEVVVSADVVGRAAVRAGEGVVWAATWVTAGAAVVILAAVWAGEGVVLAVVLAAVSAVVVILGG